MSTLALGYCAPSDIIYAITPSLKCYIIVVTVTHGLPDMSTLSPQACGPQASGVRTYQANHSCLHVLQLLNVCIHILKYVGTYMHLCSLMKVNFCSCTYTHVASGPFDCEAMMEFLSKNSFALLDLPFDQIKLDLVGSNVISYRHKKSMDGQSSRSLTGDVLQIIHSCLYNKQPKKFKSLLQVMEQSGNAILEDTAKALG